MGNGAQGGARGEPSETAELRQIDALNRIEPGPRRQPNAPDSGTSRSNGNGPGGHSGHSTPAGMPGTVPWDEANGAGTSRWRDALLLETGHALAEADSLSDALKEVIRLYTPGLALDGVVVFGVTDKFLNVLGQVGYRRVAGEEEFRMPVANPFPATEVIRSGRPVYLSSPREYEERFPESWPLAAAHGRSSWAFLPLVVSGRITAVCMLAFSAPTAFTPDERGLLVLVARLVAQALERTRTSTAELALSRGLRRSMGSSEPAVPGISVATRYVPTGGGLVVGGDWYDIINLPDDRLALVIGDVEGHDVHAAGLMAQLRTAVHAYAAEGHGPDAVLARTSRFLSALDEDRYATCLYIEAEPETGLLHIARAGHPHPVLRLPDGTCMIKHVRGGLPLGLMPDDHDYPVTDLELQPGEVMMLCTDGLIETGGHDMFTGWVRVRDAMEPGPGSDLEGMADRLIDAVHHPMAQYEEDVDAEDRVQAEAAGAAASGLQDGIGGRRVRLAPRNEDDIALLLLRRDTDVRRLLVPERRLVLTIGQDQGEGLAEARAEVVALLHDWAQPDQVDTAVLLASELVGNVLVHTDQSAVLAATVTGEVGHRELKVEVSDRGDELPHQRAPGELASSGRGLMMLDILSAQWSVRPESEGKTVWFSLAEDAEPAAPPEPPVL
ncbi:MAG: SpoIIE family protein phosphatase [Actinomycetia bacterium]|nr:SpoIIE family protein phosphatase [Actinomycetes bacterium]